MYSTLVLAAAFAFSSFAAAQAPQVIPTCSRNSKCPESAPCCSAYGQCGAGAYCLGGCDPLSSHSLNSCAPAPTCKSDDFKFTSFDGMQQNTIYLGDASSTNWVVEGRPLIYDNSILLTLSPDSSGTLLSSTHYVWYGKISATMRTSRGAGVVTAFIMMSDVKDEIDFEFVGADVQHAQSNFYYQGITDYTEGRNLSAPNTDSDTHTYTLDWQPDQLTWAVDGTILRTLKRSDTLNSTDNQYHYPQTPSRIMISLWPAGISKNGEGTIEWSGGLIDWNSPYMVNGYYAAEISEVNVECYQPPSDAKQSGDNSYIYTDNSGTESSIEMVSKLGILSSMYATGENPGVDPNASASAGASGSATKSASAPVDTSVQTVPGVVGAGTRGDDAGQNQAATNGGVIGGASGPSSGSGVLAGNGGQGVTNGQFMQNNNGADGSGGSGGTGDAAAGRSEQALQGSAFAVLVALVALVAA